MKMRVTGKIISYLLTTALVAVGLGLSSFGTMEVRAAGPTAKNINLNIGNSIAGIEDPTSKGNDAAKWEGSKVYFGNNLWRILDNDKSSETTTGKQSGYAFLFSDNKMCEKVFHSSQMDITWDNCQLRKDLNGTDNAGASGTLLGDNFTTAEKDTIAALTIVNPDNPSYFTNGGNPTTDKLFLLSIQEVSNTDYGFGSNSTRRNGNGDTNGYWFLRSPGNSRQLVATVGDAGMVAYGGEMVRFDGWVRPAFNLNLSEVLFSSASGIDKGVDYASFSEVLDGGAGANIWKLTIKGTDSTLNAQVTDGNTSLQKEYAEEILTIGHTAANTVLTGDDVTATQVSAMLTDNKGTVLYYGKINGDTSAESSTLTIPTGLAENYYSLYVFAENVNNGNLTDYASALESPITIKIGNPSAASINQGASNADNHEDTHEDTHKKSLTWTYNSGNTESRCVIDHQGPNCIAAFQAATPKTYKEIFSFNILLKDNDEFKPSFTKRDGKFVLDIPEEYQKKDRTFALIGIDKNGYTKLFTDEDLGDESFTTILDIEGYAFSLIYSDDKSAVELGRK